MLLNLMETSILAETKYGKTRSARVKTAVFATSNNIHRLSAPLQSRFFIIELEPYTYEQFSDITTQLLSHHNIERRVVGVFFRSLRCILLILGHDHDILNSSKSL